DLSGALPALDMPVTVVAGERDNLLPRVHARRIASLVPRARLVEIPDAGHMLPIEVPDRLTEILVGVAEQVRAAKSPPGAGDVGTLTDSSPDDEARTKRQSKQKTATRRRSA
ncbi:MAG: alpha/beta fold hydrolase, partial [Acidimicrobiales bacterium]